MKQTLIILAFVLLTAFVVAFSLGRYVNSRVLTILEREGVIKHLNSLERKIIVLESGQNYDYLYK